jgi:hypothetical protein
MPTKTFPRIAWQTALMALLLAAVISWAVAPSPAYARPMLTAIRSGNSILLMGAGFEPKQIYYLNVRAGKVDNARTGYVATTPTGDFRKQFPIPQRLLKYKNLDVCVRHARTGVAKCARLK